MIQMKIFGVIPRSLRHRKSTLRTNFLHLPLRCDYASTKVSKVKHEKIDEKGIERDLIKFRPL